MIQLIEIREIEIEQYEGDVFNLETETEEYVASSIVIHNCPHLWDVKPDRAADCKLLWLGE